MSLLTLKILTLVPKDVTICGSHYFKAIFTEQSEYKFSSGRNKREGKIERSDNSESDDRGGRIIEKG
jgi:hypothetical protein